MRRFLITAATVALCSCGGGSGTNNSTTSVTTTASSNQPAPAAPAPLPAAPAPANTAAPVSEADAELAAIQKSNAEEATASARRISSERDPDARASTCIVFLGISREERSGNVGFDDVAMRQAQDQWKADLAQRMTQGEADQLTGSSVNMLLPAEAKARDAASAWCVRNEPEVDPA